MAAEIKKNGIVQGNLLEKTEYIKLTPGCYITTDVYVPTNTIIQVKTICKWETGESGRDLMGFSANIQGYWGVSENGLFEQHGINEMWSTTTNNIYEKNTVTYGYLSTTDSGTYQIGALIGMFSVRTKYIYEVEIYLDGVLNGRFIPVNGGMINTVTNHLCIISNSGYSLSSATEVKMYKNETGIKPNLFLGTNVEYTNNEYLVHSYEFAGNRNIGLIPGQTYTLTVCFTPGTNMTSWIPHMSGGITHICAISNISPNTKQIKTVTFVMPNYYTGKEPSTNPYYSNFNMYRLPNDGTTTDATIHWIKVEEGDKFTGYALAESEGFEPMIEKNPIECNEIIEI